MHRRNFTRLFETPKTIPALFLGAMSFSTILIIAVLSIPVYIFRQFVIQLARVSRPDLDQILDVASSALSNDYFANTPAPRSNCVLTLYFQGHVTASEVKATVLKNWINARDEISGQLLYGRLQHYPERWLGFTFWKNGSSKFHIDNHVQTISGTDVAVTDDMLTEIIEDHLNSTWKKEQSPWMFSVVENYRSSSGNDPQSILIFNMHHCLSDGYGMMTAFIEGFFQHGSMNKLSLPDAVRTQRSFLQKIWFALTLPISAFIEYSYLMSHVFKGSPWLVPDGNKKWHQVVARSDPIAIQDIKRIKNKFGVGFTSVLISAVSSATNKSLEMSCGNGRKTDSMICVSAIPMPGVKKRKEISNNLAAVIFDIPTTDFESPVARLRNVDRSLRKNKGSAVPLALHYLTKMLGGHFYFVCELLLKNRIVPMGLSNMAGMPEKLTLNGKPVLHVSNTAGCTQGDCAVGISVVSHEEEIRISVVVEEALMSSQEAKEFAMFINREIQSLREMTATEKWDRNANADMIQLS